MKTVVVIGAGLVGAAVTYRLSRAGLAVTLLEANRPAGGTSSHSFAWVNANDKPPRAYHALNAAGLAEYRRLAAELGGDWFQPIGNVVWATTAAAQTALRERVARLQRWDYTAALIDHFDATAMLPGLRLPPAGTAQFAAFADEGWVAVPLLIEHLLAAASTAGAQLRWPVGVERLLVDAGRVVGVVAAGQPLTADLVIDCSGPAAGRLLAPLGRRLPLRRSPGLLITTEPVVSGLRHIVHTPALHLRPDGGGRLLIGSTAADAALDDLADGQRHLAPESPLAQALLASAAALVPALADVGLEAARIGWRPLPADGWSTVGPATI